MSVPISFDEANFYVTMAGTQWKTLFVFGIAALREGASLQRLMNEKIRATLKHSSSVVPKDELKQVARATMPPLREVVETYMERPRER